MRKKSTGYAATCARAGRKYYKEVAAPRRVYHKALTAAERTYEKSVAMAVAALASTTEASYQAWKKAITKENKGA